MTKPSAPHLRARFDPQGPAEQAGLARRGLSWVICALLGLAASAATAQSAEPPPAVSAGLAEAVRLYGSGERHAAGQAFERLARSGSTAAHYNLAVMHLRGEVVGARPEVARRHMLAAALGGFVSAQVALAQMDETGTGGPLDRAASQRWYERAAEAGSVEAQVAAATNHYLGRGTPVDRAAAVRWYERAAMAGEVGAQYLLASMYETGDGVATDLDAARRWYEAAARNGDPAAPLKLRSLAGGGAPTGPTGRP